LRFTACVLRFARCALQEPPQAPALPFPLPRPLPYSHPPPNQQLVIAAFKHRTSPKARGSPDTGAPEADLDLERRLLATFDELYRCPYADVRDAVLQGLYEVRP
jgi:hypothetical protein